MLLIMINELGHEWFGVFNRGKVRFFVWIRGDRGFWVGIAIDDDGLMMLGCLSR